MNERNKGAKAYNIPADMVNDKYRLDVYLVTTGQAPTRSQAESMIRLGDVRVNGAVVTKPGSSVRASDVIKVADRQRYVSRAGLKLASVAEALDLDFRDKVVLDVGSSTGGFSDYALQHGARRVVAVDVGTDQLHPSLRSESRIELHEKTDIRDFKPLSTPDLVLIDVSFISLREILPHIAKSIAGSETQVIAMVKPQFEAGRHQVSRGVIKNDSVRRRILQDFESWVRTYFVVIDKRDSQVSGSKGNLERFYKLRKVVS